jgi:HEAT repeat protein
MSDDGTYEHLERLIKNEGKGKTVKSAGPVVRWGCGGWIAKAILLTTSLGAAAQVAPLAPRWLAGTPPPSVETFSAGLERHHIPLTEQALFDALKNPDGEVRSLAAAQLVAMDDQSALRYIVSAFQDERDPQVQVNIAGAASWMGSHLAIEQLQTMCKDINTPPMTRLDAARYVSHKQLATCFPAVKGIAHYDQDPAVRVQAIFTALNYQGQSSGALEIALQGLKDPEPTVRTAAADALHSLHAVSATKALKDALQSETDQTARGHIREALSGLN